MRRWVAFLWMGGAVGVGTLAAYVTTDSPSRAVSLGSERRPAPGLSGGTPTDPSRVLSEPLVALERALTEPLSPTDLVQRIDAVRRAELVSAAPLLAKIILLPAPDSVVLAALQALSAVGGEPSIAALVRVARERPEWRAQTCVRLSRIVARDALETLVTTIREENDQGEIAAAAVRALGRTRLRQALPELTRLAAGAEDHLVRRNAVEGLGWVADPESLDLLEHLCADPNRSIRLEAIGAVGQIRSERSIQILEALLVRSEPGQERDLLDESLRLLKGQRVSPW